MGNLPQQSRRWGRVALAALVTLLSLVAGAAVARPASAEGGVPVKTEPAPNEVVAAPEQVVVRFASAVDPAGATFKVLGADGSTVASGALRSDGADPATLVAPTPALPDGIYTVVWSTAGASAASGAFAFSVDPTAATPKPVTYPKAVAKLQPTRNVLVEWVPWIAIMTFVGVLMLRFMVAAPVAGRFGPGGDTLAAATDRRLLRVAALALVVFVPATVVQLAFVAGENKHAAFGKIWDTIAADGDGHVWFFRLVVTGLAALLVWPAAALAGRSGRRLRLVMLAGLVLGLAELLARVVPTAVPPNKPRTVFGTLFRFAHIGGAAVWIGGLVGIVSLALGGVVASGQRGRFWPPAIRRFSLTAMSCVGAIVLSGLWLYWANVSSPRQLTSTLYGRTLIVKLVGVALLVTLGAVNHLWLRPRLDARHAAGDERGIVALVRHHFRTVVGVEVVLGLAVLFAVPYLAGSARAEAFQKQQADIARSAAAGSIPVTLRPSGLQPGLTRYDVTVPASVKSVAVAFRSDKLGVPTQTVEAEKVADGRFRVSGFYTPVAGPWQVDVGVDGVPERAGFTLPIKAEAARLGRPPSPPITRSFYLWALAEGLVVVLALVGTSRLGRARAQQHGRRLTVREPAGDTVALSRS